MANQANSVSITDTKIFPLFLNIHHDINQKMNQDMAVCKNSIFVFENFTVFFQTVRTFHF